MKNVQLTKSEYHHILARRYMAELAKLEGGGEQWLDLDMNQTAQPSAHAFTVRRQKGEPAPTYSDVYGMIEMFYS